MKYDAFILFAYFLKNVKLFGECSLLSSKNNNFHSYQSADCIGNRDKDKEVNNMRNLMLNSTLLEELKSKKFYVRGHTNIEGHTHCSMQERWGPAKDVSYFLYDVEPYDQDRDFRKRRMKRKYKTREDENPVEDEDYDNQQEVGSEEEGQQENSFSKEAKYLASHKSDKKEKHRIRSRHEWQSWGPWGICSATCGKGTRSRWRHCLSTKCPRGEKQAELQACINTPCN